MPIQTIDMFEYSTDASAQSAYVSSGSGAYSSDITATMTSDALPVPNVVTCSAYYSNPPTEYHYCWQAFDKNTVYPYDWYAYPNSSCWLKYNFGAGNTPIVTKYTLMVGHDPQPSIRLMRSWTFSGSNNDSNYTVLDSHVNDTGQTLAGSSYIYPYTFANAIGYQYYRLDVTAVNSDYTMIKEMTMHTTTSSSLTVYSENTIKSQGSYSLKAVATITASLNNTLTHTFSPTLNLTGVGTIYVDVYSSRTGSNIKFGFHDSGGTTTEFTPNITGANSWQTCSFDISGVSSANKDVIDTLTVTIVNADSANTFYLDNMYYMTASTVYLKQGKNRTRFDLTPISLG